ncbi:hypothetical protein KTN05_10625 [Paracoccus sp. Z118]|nr:hypothetical protein [Paracoccus sp. Z118]
MIDKGSVWVLAAPLTVWAGHFLLSYWVGAVWCAKGWGPLVDTRIVMVVLTLSALLAVSLLARIARQRYRGVLVVDEAIDDPTENGRTRFMGHVALMLSVLAAVAIVMTFLPTLVFERC